MSPNTSTLAEARRMLRECSLMAVFEGLVDHAWPDSLDIRVGCTGGSMAGFQARPHIQLDLSQIPAWHPTTAFDQELRAPVFAPNDWRGPIADGIAQLVAKAVSATPVEGVRAQAWALGPRWRETYRLLRRSYIDNGAYLARTGLPASGLEVRDDAAGAALVRALMDLALVMERIPNPLPGAQTLRPDIVTAGSGAVEEALRAVVPLVRARLHRAPRPEKVQDWLGDRFSELGVPVRQPLAVLTVCAQHQAVDDPTWTGVQMMCSARLEQIWGDTETLWMSVEPPSPRPSSRVSVLPSWLLEHAPEPSWTAKEPAGIGALQVWATGRVPLARYGPRWSGEGESGIWAAGYLERWPDSDIRDTLAEWASALGRVRSLRRTNAMPDAGRRSQTELAYLALEGRVTEQLVIEAAAQELTAWKTLGRLQSAVALPGVESGHALVRRLLELESAHEAVLAIQRTFSAGPDSRACLRGMERGFVTPLALV